MIGTAIMEMRGRSTSHLVGHFLTIGHPEFPLIAQ